jgi:serine protease Do/serine protease DegQ
MGKVVGVILSVALYCFSTASHSALPAAVDGQQLPTLAPMLERVQGAVVNISTESTIRIKRRVDPLFDDPFFRRFFDYSYRDKSFRPERQRKRQGLGSGVILDSALGIVLTNAHVIEGADKITVTLKDGREMLAKVLGADKDSDVAVIQIEADNLTEIPIGNSDQLRVGDFVVAIGNPFGLRQTVTSGIISALGRSGLGIEAYEDFIQTDASINPGNSGGALVDLSGQLIGINTAIMAPSGGNVGIGFSIPINMALKIKQQLVEFGEVQRGRLGVKIQDLTADLSQAFELENSQGAIISKVEIDSAADKAGIKAGDVVLRANGRVIRNGADLRNAIGLLRVGDTLDLDVIREGAGLNLSAVIGEIDQDSSVGKSLNPNLEGATFSELTDLQLSNGLESGVLIASVEKGSPAWYHQLRPDDVVVSVNRRKTANLDEFKAVIGSNQVLLLNVVRGNGALFVLIQ